MKIILWFLSIKGLQRWSALSNRRERFWQRWYDWGNICFCICCIGLQFDNHYTPFIYFTYRCTSRGREADCTARQNHLSRRSNSKEHHRRYLSTESLTPLTTRSLLTRFQAHLEGLPHQSTWVLWWLLSIVKWLWILICKQWLLWNDEQVLLLIDVKWF